MNGRRIDGNIRRALERLGVFEAPEARSDVRDALEYIIKILEDRIAPRRKYFRIGVIEEAKAAAIENYTSPPASNYQIINVYEEILRTPDLEITNFGPGNLYAVISYAQDQWLMKEATINIHSSLSFPNVHSVALRADWANTTYMISERRSALRTINIDYGERIFILSSNSTQHFTESLSQNEQEFENISGMVSNKVFIRGVNIQAMQNLYFRVIFWSSADGASSDLDEDSFLDYVDLDLATTSFQTPGTPQYRLNVNNLNIVYEDQDKTRTLHVSLQNLSSTDKLAAPDGAVQIDFKMSPRL